MPPEAPQNPPPIIQQISWIELAKAQSWIIQRVDAIQSGIPDEKLLDKLRGEYPELTEAELREIFDIAQEVAKEISENRGKAEKIDVWMVTFESTLAQMITFFIQFFIAILAYRLGGKIFTRTDQDHIYYSPVSFVNNASTWHLLAMYQWDRRINLRETFWARGETQIKKWIEDQMGEQDFEHQIGEAALRRSWELIYDTHGQLRTVLNGADENAPKELPGHDTEMLTQLIQLYPEVARLFMCVQDWTFKIWDTSRDDHIRKIVFKRLKKFCQWLYQGENARLEKSHSTQLVRKVAALFLESPYECLECIWPDMFRTLRLLEFSEDDIVMAYEAMKYDGLKVYSDEEGSYIALGSSGKRLYFQRGEEGILQRIIIMAYIYPWRHELHSGEVLREV
jgi:hypothetical protein